MEGPAAGRPRHELVGGDGGLCSLERVVRGGERCTSLLAADFRWPAAGCMLCGVLASGQCFASPLQHMAGPLPGATCLLSCHMLLLMQAAAPGLAWSTYFEEPAMLLAFVLLGRTLEQRAKIAASSNLLALQACSAPAPSAL